MLFFSFFGVWGRWRAGCIGSQADAELQMKGEKINTNTNTAGVCPPLSLFLPNCSLLSVPLPSYIGKRSLRQLRLWNVHPVVAAPMSLVSGWDGPFS
ncbi:uncharacterized protein LY79DRAFT_262825 [Colletotrichum navitas]|uniref:Secreted protein n=1 Tax=Colletotrichum navitas TaxID=681940 RepID=A0AAD8PWB1_9PEZI|nr:uncharacterized protein LY79DRAFT_262825 [Colletotrichum navitas]KAK1585672.1 hypothetical protein LY79DRAFT_262825 [Colletotrichum navitas]